jgi:multidrug resistance efflux pump
MRRRPSGEAAPKILLAAATLAAALVALIYPGILSAQGTSFTAAGRVEGAAPTLAIGAAASGTVDAVLVREGIRVSAGQPLVKLNCAPLEAQVRAREAQLAASQATYDRVRNGSRPDEIAVGEAVVGYSQARSEEAQKTLGRTEELQEGVTVSTARVLEVQRDARIAQAQLQEARARLSLLRAGSREEDVRQSEALRNAASAELDMTRAQLDQCTIHAPVDGVVLDVLVSPGQYLSLALPQPLLHMVQDDPLRVRADVEPRDLAHVCTLQNATVSADAFPNAAIHAQVASISPVVRTASSPGTGADVAAKDFVPVVLQLAHGGPALPIGLPVTVHFEPCPSKT